MPITVDVARQRCVRLWQEILQMPFFNYWVVRCQILRYFTNLNMSNYRLFAF